MDDRKVVKVTLMIECECGKVRHIDCPDLIVDARLQRVVDAPCEECGATEHESMAVVPEYA